MPHEDGPGIVAVPESPWSRPGDAYVIAVNEDEQHAVWPNALPLPVGWRQESAAMNRPACLADIAATWKDIAPATLRRPAETSGSNDRPYVHYVLEEQAHRRPHAVAVVSAEKELTYRQLVQSANQLAHYLQGLGVGPEALVGVSVERGIEAIRWLLAALKAGGAYVPLDPALPSARLTQMYEQARPAVILADSAGAEAFSGTRARLLLTEELAAEMTGQPTTPPSASLRDDNIAYVIYTSGSTGRPKAVAVSHGSLARQSDEVSRAYQISSRDRVLQLASLGFDTSLEQIFVTLLRGATLMLPPPGILAPTDLLRYLAEQRVTVMDLTPAYWHQLVAIAEPEDERLRDIRLMITGGEIANRDDCGSAMRATGRARLVNAYGLTETTITSTLFDVHNEVASPVPVGQPLPHAQVLVLDENLETVSAGATGEIYIGGLGVARGYLGQPGLTAERFVPNPHDAVPGSRMYRTGDLGRWLGDQNLEVMGRADRQLKIRGYRVEPAEIESALTEHPDISAAAIVAHELSPGNSQLTAYYERRHDEEAHEPTLSGETLRAFVSARVPSFMVPAEFVPLHEIPRTTDGDVDRRSLAYPLLETASDPDGEHYTPTQAGLSYLWAKILKARRIGLDDDFFARGGNSLLAAEMLAHTRVMFGIGTNYVRPLTRCLLRDPTLRGFAAATQAARAGALDAESAGPRVDFAREAELGSPIRQDGGSPPDWQRPRQVLLTGATGFLGVHLLRELLAMTTAQVHCLVRADDPAHALRRIDAAAERYALGDLAMDRVVPVAGDLAEPGLALAPGAFTELSRTIDAIYHAGALVNFVYPYTELRAANVTGTRELIRLAGLSRGIPVHYVSTTAVLAGFGVMGVNEVTEETPLAYADHLCIGYVESKFVAEELLRSAGRAGLPIAIYRPLDIVGDHRSGASNTATEMCALMRFMTDTGLAPDIDLPLDFVPADICAAATAYISTHAQATGRTYHLSSPKYALLGSLVDRLRHHGFAVETVPYSEWVRGLVKHAARHPAHPMTPFVPLFVDRSAESGLTVAEMYFEHVFPSYSRSHTEQALRGSGIAFPAVDEELLDLNIARLIATGYLRDPATLGGSRCRSAISRTGIRSKSGHVRETVQSPSAVT
jgi:amino acid adenylation domain-containing protein/thioester reductase-like protein